jgi:poly-gamma-glutamate synthesis protein (capsule biosynthesis protein)
MRALTPVVASVALLATAACSAAEVHAEPPATSRAAGPATTAVTPAPAGGGAGPPATSGGATTGPVASDPTVLTMAFGGDVHFEDYLEPLATDPDGLAELQSTLGAADLAMVNLETAITERGTKIGKEFHFRTPASALRTVAGAGVDVVSMANNHGVDFGPVGLKDTLAAKKASPIPIVGIGADVDEALEPATLDAKGLRIAVFGASQVYEMTLASYAADGDSGGIASASPLTQLRTAVTRAARTHDLVVAYLHWGLDYQACPDVQSISTAKALEAAGADIIVGGHSHRVNGAGWLGRAYVDYGLGNFVWWRSREPDARTGVLTLSIDVAGAKAKDSGRSVVRDAEWTAMLVDTDGIPRVPGAADGKRLHRLWERARACTGLAGTPGE